MVGLFVVMGSNLESPNPEISSEHIEVLEPDFGEAPVVPME